jgi:hypothetical protein
VKAQPRQASAQASPEQLLRTETTNALAEFALPSETTNALAELAPQLEMTNAQAEPMRKNAPARKTLHGPPADQHRHHVPYA